jgi:hypothetical protein
MWTNDLFDLVVKQLLRKAHSIALSGPPKSELFAARAIPLAHSLTPIQEPQTLFRAAWLWSFPPCRSICDLVPKHSALSPPSNDCSNMKTCHLNSTLTRKQDLRRCSLARVYWSAITHDKNRVLKLVILRSTIAQFTAQRAQTAGCLSEKPLGPWERSKRAQTNEGFSNVACKAKYSCTGDGFWNFTVALEQVDGALGKRDGPVLVSQHPTRVGLSRYRLSLSDRYSR